MCMHKNTVHVHYDGSNFVFSMQQAAFSEEEMLAQAMCQFSANTEGIGRVYAVGRACNGHSKTCNEICTDSQLTTQDQQTKHDTWFCVGAYHVYVGRPNTNLGGDVGSAKLGLKSAKTYCDTAHCGPNFCCCFARIGGAIE